MSIATDLTKKIRYAEIQTTRAIYSRAAVIGESETTLTVQYYRVKEKKSRAIQHDVIAKKDIVSIRYYID